MKVHLEDVFYSYVIYFEYIKMKKINRVDILNILILAVLSGVVVFKYEFLWPVLLFVVLGNLPNRVRGK